MPPRRDSSAAFHGRLLRLPDHQLDSSWEGRREDVDGWCLAAGRLISSAEVRPTPLEVNSWEKILLSRFLRNTTGPSHKAESGN